MDNLAHSLVGVAAGFAVRSHNDKTRPAKIVLASILCANAPDLDFLLYFISSNTYHFHHRGLTHSFIGLPLMLGLCFWLCRKLFDRESFSNHRILAFCMVQILFTHMFLDYLTSFGVMIFYPLSMFRVSYPLMFILDPLLWLIGTLTCLCIYLMQRNARSPQELRTASLLGLGAVALLWVFEWTQKVRAEEQVTASYPAVDFGKITSYPFVGAPLNWNIIRENDSGKLLQTLVWLREPRSTPIPNEWIHNDYCRKPATPEAQQTFANFRRWAGPTLCREMTSPTSQQGCHCISLKYGFASWQSISYGSYFLNTDGALWEWPYLDKDAMIRAISELSQ